ncbi:MAG TPA: helix-turn-helix domain-containing protein [Acidimicrobiia bacterium]|nr:helix-turn-helix domain-containing protein [Acidimicrobiia bacterium]
MTRDRHDRTGALGETLRKRRQRLGLTQQEVADLASCSERTVRSAEAGKATLRLDVLIRILDVLGLDLSVVERQTGQRTHRA